MAKNNDDLAVIADFDQIKENLQQERKTIIKVNTLEESEELVRESFEASIVLDLVQLFQKKILEFLTEYPSLCELFYRDFKTDADFFSRENILDLCFLEDAIFPEIESFLFGQDGGLSPEIYPFHVKAITDWTTEKKKNHLDTKSLIADQEKFNLDIKLKDLGCQCRECSVDLRNRIREMLFSSCCEQILELKNDLISGDFSFNDETAKFFNLKKSIDKSLYKVRYRLKRSALNRLETQVKGMMRDSFNYPRELAIKRSNKVKVIFNDYLIAEDFSLEIVNDNELERFFEQLSLHLWRSKDFLLKEFKKLVKSLMILKKKDLSSQILQNYLGEFWAHTNVRDIKRKIIYHMGPTNSGKTYHAIEALCEAKKGCYLAPLRLLASELYDTMNKNGVRTSLLTGEEVVEVEGATHTSSTIEMARLQENFDCCVIDEIQMITDPQRGWAWTRALVNIFADEIHICGDPSVLDLVKNIVNLCGDELEVRTYERMTELIVEEKTLSLSDLRVSDALIVFSRRNALRAKADLEKIGLKVSIIYGRLGPEVRREQARKFDKGITDVIVSTDAIAMGMNLPIKRIVFSTLSKFINSKEHIISDSEIKQIAGRAGRYQRFPTGYVNCLSSVDKGISSIEDALYSNLEQKEKCMVGPDLDIYSQVNQTLEDHKLSRLLLSEFLRLFNTMTFKKPFFCVDLKEMIELAEIVEEADRNQTLSVSEIFGYTCAPVNMGLLEHVQYYLWILNHYIAGKPIDFEKINGDSNDIDYLETSIKCIELFQWISRHFNNKNFNFDAESLLINKQEAVVKLNDLLSRKNILSDEVQWKKKRSFRSKGRPHYSKNQSSTDNSNRRPKSRKRKFVKKK